jgi:SsrA-binding protein
MDTQTITKNRKAYHEYQVIETWQAGIALLGTEVKALRAGKANLIDGWVDVSENLRAILRQVKIGTYLQANINNHPEERPRPLLLKKAELKKLYQASHQKGFTIIPLQLYFQGPLVKVEIAIAKGKKLHDKRDTAREKQDNRDISRALKNRQK